MSNNLRVDGRARGADSTAAIAYSVPDAAARIGLSRSTMYELIRGGKIPIIKIGNRTLISEEDLRLLLQRHRIMQ